MKKMKKMTNQLKSQLDHLQKVLSSSIKILVGKSSGQYNGYIKAYDDMILIC